MDTISENIEQNQYLTFHIAEEEYAIRILRVKEIIQFNTVTRVPAVPSYIRGVINLRGNVVSVIDLASKFGLQETQITKRTCIVIVEVEQEGSPTDMGVMADAVSQVVGMSDDDLKPAPSFGSQINVDYLEGMGKMDKKFALILNIDKVLTSEEFQTVTSVKEAMEAKQAGGDEPEAV